MVMRQGNNILVVTDLEKVLCDDAVDQAASHSQAGISTSGNNRPFCFSGVHGKHPATLSATHMTLNESDASGIDHMTEPNAHFSLQLFRVNE